MRKRLSARPTLRKGNACDFIARAANAIHSGDKVLLACRVSGHIQQRNGNLNDQQASLTQRATALGATVVDVVTHVRPGTDPYWLARAAGVARRHGAKLLAESTDRLIRHPAYHSGQNPDAQARQVDLEDLARYTDGVVLCTDLDPNATPHEVRSYQRRRGQSQKKTRADGPESES